MNIKNSIKLLRAECVKMDIRSTIKDKRKRLGFSQEDISRRIGVSRSQYSSFERGVRNLSFERLESLVYELGLRIVIVDDVELIQIKYEGEMQGVWKKF